MKLILFDLDNTLLSGDSDYAWAQFLIERGAVEREKYERGNAAFYQAYLEGRLDIHAFLEFQLRPLTLYPRARLDAWHRQFMQEKILPMIGDKARELIDQHARRAHLMAIVTSTNNFIAAPIAKELDIAHLIATEAEETDGCFTGKVKGVPCFREGKVVKLENWLEQQGLRWVEINESWFYSDSLNDLVLFERVSHPIAVDPAHDLREHALHQGWPIISLR
jgi:HAD superfamily hydrolase (TIGR01490 family)